MGGGGEGDRKFAPRKTFCRLLHGLVRGRHLPQEEGMCQVGWAKPIFLACELKF